MAKDNKKPAEAKENKSAVTEMTAENVMEVIKNKNLMTDDAVKAAAEQIEKDKAEDQKREAMRAIKRFEYKNASALIELRKRRAEEKATKEHLTKTKEILDGYLAGKTTRVESEKLEKEAEEAKRKAFKDIEQEFNQNYRELRDAYPGYYSYDWDCRW